MLLLAPLPIFVVVQTAASSSNLCDSADDYHALLQTASTKYMKRSSEPPDTLPENTQTPISSFSSMLQLQQRAVPQTVLREGDSDRLFNDEFGFYGENDRVADARNTASFSAQQSQHAKSPEKPLNAATRLSDKQAPLVSDDLVADGRWAGAENTEFLSSQPSQKAEAPEKPLEESKRVPDKHVPLVSDDRVADGSWAGAENTALLSPQPSQKAQAPEKPLEEFKRVPDKQAPLVSDDSVAGGDWAGAENTAFLSSQQSQQTQAPEGLLEEGKRVPDKHVPFVSDDGDADGSWTRAGNTVFSPSHQSQRVQAPEKLMDELKQPPDMHIMNNFIRDHVASSDDDMSGGGRNTAFFTMRQSPQARALEKGLEELSLPMGETAHLFSNNSVADGIGMARSPPFFSTPLLRRAQSPEELEFRQQSFGQTHLSNDDDDEDMANGLTRPNLGKGPDIVHFGILVKNFYGMDLKDYDFTVDMISTITWTDHRAAAKVPPGVHSLTMSESQARKAIWVPRVAITNRDVRSIEDISTSFSIHTSGEVHRVFRQLVVLKQKFILTKFPFDSHDLEIRIASSKYMADEVVLVPSANVSISGISSKQFDGVDYYFKDWKLSSFEDDNGDLKKSRGLLSIHVKREPGTYWDNQMLPAILLMTLSCSVFWFPFVSQFVTPRLALSILALLNFQNLMNRIQKELPAGHPENWDDIMNQNLQMAMVINCVMNVYTEVHFHVTKMEELTKRFNTELKYGTVSISGVLILFIYISGLKDLMSHAAVNILCKIILIGGAVAYIFFCESRVRQEQKYRARQESLLESKPENK